MMFSIQKLGSELVIYKWFFLITPHIGLRVGGNKQEEDEARGESLWYRANVQISYNQAIAKIVGYT